MFWSINTKLIFTSYIHSFNKHFYIFLLTTGLDSYIRGTVGHREFRNIYYILNWKKKKLIIFEDNRNVMNSTTKQYKYQRSVNNAKEISAVQWKEYYMLLLVFFLNLTYLSFILLIC